MNCFQPAKSGSNRRKAVLTLQCQHEYIASSRKDFLNKLAYSLIARYDFIAREDLQIQRMVRNHHLSKSILDAGWGYLKQRLAVKTAEAGRQIVLVNPAPTSKTYSSCGAFFEGLSLADRWVECSSGLSVDRDVNAAPNVLWVGQTHWDRSTDNGPRQSQEAPPLQRPGSIRKFIAWAGKPLSRAPYRLWTTPRNGTLVQTIKKCTRGYTFKSHKRRTLFSYNEA